MGTCSEAMSSAGFNTHMGPTCSMDNGGFSFHVISAAPTADQIKKICTSSACKTVMAAMKAAQPTECTTSGWNFQLYAQIFNPIDQVCGGGSPPAPPPTSPPAPPPTPPPTAPPPTAAPATPAPPTTTPAPPSPTSSSGDTSNGGTSGGGTSAPTTGGSSAGTSSGSDAQTTPVGSTNSTWTQAPSTNGSIASSRNSTGTSNINNATTDASSSSNSTMIIAIVAGVVVVIALVAFLAFRAGKRKNESPREVSYVGAPHTTKSTSAAVVARSAPHGGVYVPSPVTEATTTSAGATRSSGALTRSAGRSPAYNSNTSKAFVGSNASAAAATGATGLWTDRAIEKARIPLEDILMGDVLSQGAFGEVLRGSYNGETVAIKRLLPARRKDMKEIESFLEEAKLLTSLRHQRIVGFVGVAWDSLTDLCVVTEFMDGGDLRSLLSHANDNDEPTGFDANKVKIALHIIHALSYLHGLKPVVIHRDLKSKNVLLTRDLDAKLTDFGVSRERADKTMTANVGSSMWMAPEVMMGERYDEKADIFSFGVVLSELDTQKLPYAHAKEEGSDRQIPEMARLNMVSAGKLTVDFTEGADPDLVEIGRACVAVDPKERPTASDVLRRMHHIYRSYRHV